jgi:MOSC domain-containing protein YiiM
MFATTAQDCSLVAMSAEGWVRSVNVGRVRTLIHAHRTVTTGIFKQPVEGRVGVHGVNLDGDDQADRRVHGGPDRAVYSYAVEDLEWWAGELGRPVPPGSMGENLTTAGVEITEAVVGERWRVGSTVLQVASPRVPCFKLGIAIQDGGFPPRFARAGRPGAYLRIVTEGDIGAGDTIEIVERPTHGVTVGLIARAFHDDHRLARQLLKAPALTDEWREWAYEHAGER